MSRVSEEDPSEASSGEEYETQYSEVELQARINFHVRETKLENEKLIKENDRLKEEVEKLKRERDEAVKGREEVREDFATLLMRVGSARPEAFFTKKDLDFLVSMRQTADIARIYNLEDELMVEKGQVLKLMLDVEVLKDRDRNSVVRNDELLRDRSNMRKTMMDLQTSNAKLTMEYNQGKKVEEHLKEVIRELNELKGASSSSSAKRPRL